MTPDSLEVDDIHKYNALSYTSHNYFQCKNDNNLVKDKDLKHLSHNDYNGNAEVTIYSMPKPYISTHIVNTCQNICTAQLTDENTIIYTNVRNVELSDEVFSDSLESNQPGFPIS